MGPLTKRRHSTMRSGRRQAGQKKLALVTKTTSGYVGKRARKVAGRQATK
ncbi:MAG: hypothetical protein ABI758_05440 [Candidatus Woesebacteria bacterium]